METKEMMKNKFVVVIVGVSLIVTSLVGCSKSVEVSTTDTGTQQEQTQTVPQKPEIAKVVSIENNSLTVVLADGAGNNLNNGTSGGVTSSDPSSNNETPPEGTRPEGATQDGNQPNGTPPNGTRPEGKNDASTTSGTAMKSDEMKFTGQEETYTLSDSIKITQNDAEMELSEITAGMIIRFTIITDSDGNNEIDSITVME